MRTCRSGGWIAVGVVLAMSSPVAEAEIYKWVGDAGEMVYSSTPPKNRARVLEVFPGGDDPSPGAVLTAPPPNASEEALLARVEQLENELAAERGAREAVSLSLTVRGAGCDPNYSDCVEWGAPTFLPPTVIVTRPAFVPHRHFVPRHFPKHSQFGARHFQKDPRFFHKDPRFISPRVHDQRRFVAPKVGGHSIHHFRAAPFGFRHGRHGGH